MLNRSRVFPARLLGTRPGGGAAELLLVRQRGPDLWEALLRPARRLRPGTVVDIAPGFRARVEPDPARRAARAEPADAATRLVRLLADDAEPSVLIERHGHVPLPPYIRRPDRPADRERYQTVFAREAGSVAAPTAGLHFTPALLERLRARGIATVSVVLHVGPGTFRPVEVDDVRAHRVLAERFTIPDETAAAIDEARRAGRRVVAVGTTTTRALESRTDASGRVLPGDGETDLVIVPGLPLPDGGRARHELPSSALVTAAAGERLRRPRARARRLSGGRGRPLPLLLVWRRHADGLTNMPRACRCAATPQRANASAGSIRQPDLLRRDAAIRPTARRRCGRQVV